MADCNAYHDNMSITEQCKYIRTTEECSDNDGLVSYLQFPYCDLPNLIPLADTLLFIWIAYLFVCLAITAEDYFCPALTTISKMLKLSQNVAGVTFLALGNGSPDIFSCIAALSSGSLTTAFLAFGAMFGAGLFVNTVVVGAVTISQDGYELARRPFFRDCIFYLTAIYWSWYNCYNGELNLATGIGYIALYVFYVALVVIGRFVFQRFIKPTVNTNNDIQVNIDEGYAADVHQDYFSEDKETVPIIQSESEDNFQDGADNFDVTEWAEIPGVRSAALTRAFAVAQTLDNFPPPIAKVSAVNDPSKEDGDAPLLRHDVSFSSPLQRTPSTYEYPSYSSGAAKQMLLNFLLVINPLHLSEWDEFSIKDKIFDVVSIPGNFIFTLTIPVVELSEPLFGWNKFLNAIQLLLCPIITCFLLQMGGTSLSSVPVPVIAGCCGLLLMIIVLLTSTQGEAPIYFKAVYTLIGFGMSIVWIYTIAGEIVSLLSTFGHMFLINGAILGLTVLSWANSIGDLVSDVAMSKQGYPQMAVSACIGGPCLNMLLGIGLASTLSIMHRGGEPIKLELSGSLIISSAFLMVNICSHLIFIPLMKFNVKRWYGFYLFILYACFLLIALLNITGVFTI